jgi:hypothetical protein
MFTKFITNSTIRFASSASSDSRPTDSKTSSAAEK